MHDDEVILRCRSCSPKSRLPLTSLGQAHELLCTGLQGRQRCMSSLDPWKTLGVPHDASEEAVKKAYRKLALQCALPDTGNSPPTSSESSQASTLGHLQHQHASQHSVAAAPCVLCICCSWPPHARPCCMRQAPPRPEGLRGGRALCQEPGRVRGRHRPAPRQELPRAGPPTQSALGWQLGLP